MRDGAEFIKFFPAELDREYSVSDSPRSKI